MKKKLIILVSVILIIISIILLVLIFKPSSEESTNSQLESIEEISTPIPQIKSPSTIETHNSEQNIQEKPAPTPDPQTYACGPGGACNSYQDPTAADCPTTFKDRYCENKCSDPTLRCRF